MRKIKLLLIIVILLLITVSSTFALRLGLEFGTPNIVLIIRPNPFDFRVGYNFTDIMSGGNSAFLFLSGDYRIIQAQLIDFLNVYLSAGLYTQLSTAGGGDGAFQFGGRIPIGLNAYLIKGTLELFAEVVPVVRFLPTLGFNFVGQGFVGFTIRVPKL